MNGGVAVVIPVETSLCQTPTVGRLEKRWKGWERGVFTVGRIVSRRIVMSRIVTKNIHTSEKKFKLFQTFG